jgi:hypothetical protein
LNEREAALHWLQKAAEQKGGLTIYAKVHPWLDTLRGDPRFDAYLDQMGVNDPEVTSQQVPV